MKDLKQFLSTTTGKVIGGIILILVVFVISRNSGDHQVSNTHVEQSMSQPATVSADQSNYD